MNANAPKAPKGTLAREANPRPRGLRIALTVFKWGAISALALAALGATALSLMFWIYSSDPDLPRIYGIHDYKPKQVTRVLSADGKVIGELFEERRTFVTIDKI